MDRLNNLVYVKFNAELMSRHKRLRNKEKKVEVLEASDASDAFDWFVDEDAEEVELGSDADDATDDEIKVQFESKEMRADILGGDKDLET